ncbi:MAG: alpha/beta hydrolase [Alphaproteobacteria bacterium]|nr:alpha/beta hydrolase [Alphaproteobacteria bacterium]
MSGLTLERHYNPRLAVPDFQDYLDSHQRLSAAAEDGLAGTLDIHYGSHTLQTLDVHPAAGSVPASGTPVHLFLHGGYWRGLDKALYRFMVPPLVASGVTVVPVNYRLAPAVTVGEIVEDILEALRWVSDHVAEYGGDPDRITLSGHSAGAHLAALVLAHDWTPEDRPADLVKGAALLSGIYDLEPVPLLPVNQEIGLTPEHATAMSAMLRPPLVQEGIAPPRLLIGAGGDEPSDWVRQSVDYAALCENLGLPVTRQDFPGENHFSMMEQMTDPESLMFRAVRALVG